MIFNFWGNVTLLKEEKSGRLFSKYYLKSKLKVYLLFYIKLIFDNFYINYKEYKKSIKK